MYVNMGIRSSLLCLSTNHTIAQYSVLTVHVLWLTVTCCLYLLELDSNNLLLSFYSYISKIMYKAWTKITHIIFKENIEKYDMKEGLKQFNQSFLQKKNWINYVRGVFVKFVDNLVVKPKFKLILLNYISF